MIEQVIEALEPFALTLVIFSGATMLGWVKFSNSTVVGYAVVFSGVLLLVKHVIARVSNKKAK